jgi:hypothetical protein
MAEWQRHPDNNLWLCSSKTASAAPVQDAQSRHHREDRARHCVECLLVHGSSSSSFRTKLERSLRRYAAGTDGPASQEPANKSPAERGGGGAK